MRIHMRDSHFTCAAALAALGFFVAGAVAFAVQSPTLGELALKEQERRKALKVTGRLLTEQDLPSPAAPPLPSAPPAAPKAGFPEQPPAAAASEPRDEAWWRQRIGQVRDNVRRYEIIAEALQSRINALTNDFAGRDDPYQRARIAGDRQKAMAELDRVRSDVVLQKKKIEEIEEEARRAAVPPGWLR
jgi:hypothetical protein